MKIDKTKYYNLDNEYGNSMPLYKTNNWRSKIIKHVIIADAKKYLPKGTYYEIRLSPERLPTINNPFSRFIAWYSYKYIPHRLIKWKTKPKYFGGTGYFLIARLKT